MGANQWHGTDYSIPYLDSNSDSDSDPPGGIRQTTQQAKQLFRQVPLFIMCTLWLLSVLLFSLRYVCPWSLLLGARRGAEGGLGGRRWHKH